MRIWIKYFHPHIYPTIWYKNNLEKQILISLFTKNLKLRHHEPQGILLTPEIIEGDYKYELNGPIIHIAIQLEEATPEKTPDLHNPYSTISVSFLAALKLHNFIKSKIEKYAKLI